MSLLYVFVGIFIFGFLIFIHELGHFSFARLFKVDVEEFAVGMGPKIFSKTGKSGTVYSLRAIPFGGFVSMVGEDSESDSEHALCKKPVWQRMIIIAAGAAMNLLFGFFLMAVSVGISDAVYSTTVEGFNVVSSETGQLVELDEVYGIKVGDTIKKIGDRDIHVRHDFVYEVMFLGDKPVDVTVIRSGKKVVIPDVKFQTYTESGITVGKAGFIRTTQIEKTFPEIIRQSFFQSIASVRMIWASLINTVKGEYGTEALSGPVGIIDQVEETASLGVEAVLFLVIIITLNLGIANLLPIPALDGGRLLFLLVELVRGKPINPKYEGYIHAAGLVLLMGLMVFVTYNDILKIFMR